MKRSLSVAFGLSSLLVIAGCAAETTEQSVEQALAVAEGCAPSGAEVEAVSVSGEFGAAPVVTFEAPLSAVLTQRFVAIEGEGVEVQDGDILSIDYSLYNAATGDLIEESGYTEVSPTVLSLDTDAPNFVGVSLTAACSTVGSRVVGLIPPLEAFGADGATEFGLGAGESLLFIVDVIEIKPPPEPPLERLEGESADPPAGFPEVTYDDDGAPTVTIPEGDIPTEFALSAVIEGAGAEVGGGDVVVVHYHGVNWNTGEVFDSSWERGSPASFPTGGVIAGFRDGLVGQTVGSRVIIVIPPELGYGPSGGTPDGSIGATDTIVFVVDILGLQ